MQGAHPSVTVPSMGSIVDRSRSLILLVVANTALPVAAQSPPPQEPTELEGFVVTADRFARPSWAVASSTTVLDGAALEEAGIEYVSDALRSVAGISVTRSGSFGATTSLFLRGAESDHVKVLIDGVPVNEPGGAFDFGSLTTDNVERIEVVRGPASSLYGSDAMSGVVQIFTRRGTGAFHGSVSARGGSFGTSALQARVEGGTDRASYSFSLGRNDTDGILSFNNRHLTTTASGRIALRPDPKTDASVTMRVQDRRYHFPTSGSGTLDDVNAFTFGDEYVLGVSAERRWLERVATHFSINAHNLDTGTDDRSDGPADTLGFFGFQSLNKIRRHVGDVRAVFGLAAHTTATAGFELERQAIRETSESSSAFGVSPGSSDHRRWNRGYYAQLAFDNQPLALTAGARVESNDVFGTAVTYRAGAVWWSEPTRTRLRASGGTAIKEPTFFESFATGFAVGNPDLDPERSRSLEVGLDQGLGPWPVTMSITAFDQSFRDLIQFTFPAPVEGGPNYFNLAEASSRGLEMGLSSSFSAVALEANYTYLDTRVRDAGMDSGAGATFVDGNRLLRRPTHSLSASGHWTLGPTATFDLGIRRVGARDDRDFSQFPAAPVEIPAHTVVDVSGSWRVLTKRSSRPEVTLTARVENALSARYEEAWGFRAPGRALYVGGRVAYGGS